MQGCRTGCAEKDRSPPGYAPALPVIRAAGAGNLGVGKRVSGCPWAARQSNPALLVGTTGGMTCVLVQLGLAGGNMRYHPILSIALSRM